VGTATYTGGGVASWSVSGGADAAKFTIAASTGEIKTALSFVPVFAAPGSAAGTNDYALQIRIDNGTAPAATRNLVVSVTVLPHTIDSITIVEPASGIIRGRPGIPVRVRVLDQTAAPVEGATISAQAGAVYVPGDPTIYIGITDAQGYCVWENPPLGTFVGIAFFDNGL
jgi:hypothetical protein